MNVKSTIRNNTSQSDARDTNIVHGMTIENIKQITKQNNLQKAIKLSRKNLHTF